MEKNVEISILLDLYGELLTKAQKFAIKEHYDEDLSFAEIAEKLQKSRQAAADAVKKGTTALYGYEKKLGIMKRYLLFDKKINELRDIMQDITCDRKPELVKNIDELSKLWE